MRKRITWVAMIYCLCLTGEGLWAQNSDSPRYINKQELYERVVNLSNNELVLADKLPVMVVFDADWCGYCRKMEPFIDSVYHEYKGRIVIYKMKDKEKEVVSRLRIQGYPSMLLLPLDRQGMMSAGYRDLKALRELINTRLLPLASTLENQE